MQAEQWQLGQQLRQQLVQLHTAVQAGIAVDPVLIAAAVSAAAAAADPTAVTGGACPAAGAAAVASAEGGPCLPTATAAVHPRAGAVQFLQDLAACGKSAAAGALFDPP